MNKTKLILTMALTLVVLFAQVGNVAAAPLAQTATDVTGTVTGISLETDANNVTTVLVTLTDAQNVSQIVRISVDTAASLGLLQVDGNGQPILDANGLPTPVVLDPNAPLSVTVVAADIIPDTAPTEEPVVNPISTLLGVFFGVDASVIEGYHTDDGFGFGVIAQALWMSRNLTGTEDQAGDASLVEDILKAKQDKDFAAFFEAHPDLLVDGEAVPTNWGQFRKAFSNKKNNLGIVVSGHADDSNTSVQTEQNKDNGNGHGNGNGNNNGNNGNGHGNGKGNNKP